jgi:hypothetical protein
MIMDCESAAANVDGVPALVELAKAHDASLERWDEEKLHERAVISPSMVNMTVPRP